MLLQYKVISKIKKLATGNLSLFLFANALYSLSTGLINLHPIIYPENLSNHYKFCYFSFFEKWKCEIFNVANKRFKEGYCDV